MEWESSSAFETPRTFSQFITVLFILHKCSKSFIISMVLVHNQHNLRCLRLCFALCVHAVSELQINTYFCQISFMFCATLQTMDNMHTTFELDLRVGYEHNLAEKSAESFVRMPKPTFFFSENRSLCQHWWQEWMNALQLSFANQTSSYMFGALFEKKRWTS